MSGEQAMEHIGRLRKDTHIVWDDAATGRAVIDRSWWIVNGPNGGFLAALIVRGAREAEERYEQHGVKRIPRSLTVYYHRPIQEGELVVRTQMLRGGQLVSLWSVELEQNQKIAARATVVLGAAFDAPAFDEQAPPKTDMPEEITPFPEEGSFPVPIRARYDMRHALGYLPVLGEGGGDGNAAHSGGWIRLAEPEPVSAEVLAAFTDAWFPPIFAKFGLRMPVPTVDLTIHFTGITPHDPLDFCLVDFSSPVADGGYLIEDGVIWSRDGRLLARSRQLAVLR